MHAGTCMELTLAKLPFKCTNRVIILPHLAFVLYNGGIQIANNLLQFELHVHVMMVVIRVLLPSLLISTLFTT